MAPDEIATKKDIERLEKALLLYTSKIEKKDPEAMKMAAVCKALGGISPSLVDKLRQDRILSAKKLGDIWIFNKQEVLNLIPSFENESTQKHDIRKG